MTTTAVTTGPAAVRVWPPEPLQGPEGVIVFEGARYVVGQPGDLLVVGDWTCSGRRTLAVLRPSDGSVSMFDRWADEGRNLAARAVGRVERATTVRAIDADRDGCDELEVGRAGDEPVVLRAGT